ncbi:MAG: hypothetical protein KDB53_06995 [Planctomycetes bacterium]|nr:hypothetical protein [Planctomycetota bacterium]
MRDALNKIESSENVKVDFNKSKAYVTMPEGMALGEDTVRNALPSGYTLTSFKHLER